MSRVYRLAFALVIVAVGLRASPLCVSDPYSVYTTSGFVCHIGNLLFSNFSYTGSMTGEDYVPVELVNVVVDPALKQLSFQADWVIQVYDPSEDLHIGYRVVDTAAFGKIDALISSFAASAKFGGVVTPSATCNSGPPCNPMVTFTNASVPLANPGPGPVDIHNDIILQAPGANSFAHLSIISNVISDRVDYIPPPPDVPEPASLLLGLGGVIALVSYKRFGGRPA